MTFHNTHTHTHLFAGVCVCVVTPGPSYRPSNKCSETPVLHCSGTRYDDILIQTKCTRPVVYVVLQNLLN